MIRRLFRDQTQEVTGSLWMSGRCLPVTAELLDVNRVVESIIFNIIITKTRAELELEQTNDEKLERSLLLIPCDCAVRCKG